MVFSANMERIVASSDKEPRARVVVMTTRARITTTLRAISSPNVINVMVRRSGTFTKARKDYRGETSSSSFC